MRVGEEMVLTTADKTRQPIHPEYIAADANRIEIDQQILCVDVRRYSAQYLDSEAGDVNAYAEGAQEQLIRPVDR